MANCITRYIPNTLTCLNLFSGCVAAVMAFQFKYDLALRTLTRWRTTSASGWRHLWWCSRFFGRCPIRMRWRAFPLISLIWLS